MLHRTLYRDDYQMLTVGLLGGMKIHLLERNTSRKLVVEERRWVSAVIDGCQKAGIPITPENKALAEFFMMVCNCFVPGSASWRAVFSQDPREAAELIAEDYRASQGLQRPRP